MADSYSRLMDKLYLFCIWISAISIFFMSLIIPWEVFARYVWGHGVRWPEPVATMLMVLFTFLGAAASYRAGSHIAVAMVTDRMPRALQAVTATFVDLLMIVINIFILVWGFSLCMGTMHQTISALPWMPVGVTYLPLPVGALFTLLFVIERLWSGSQSERPVVKREEDIVVEGVL